MYLIQLSNAGRRNLLLSKLKNRLRYDLEGLDWADQKVNVSDNAITSSQKIIGNTVKPTVFLHGVMPRSGTNYIAELLSLHPDIESFPNEVWEFPLLNAHSQVQSLQSSFLRGYRKNAMRFSDGDFALLFGSSLTRHLCSEGHGKHALLKNPSVKHLKHFDTYFPSGLLVILLRDGRDAVHSFYETFTKSIRWPRPSFSQVCKLWDKSTRYALSLSEENSQIPLIFYEDFVGHPKDSMRDLCGRLDLNVDSYPFGDVETLGVKGSSTLAATGSVTWDMKDKDVNFKPTGKWSGWSNRQKATFKKLAGETLINGGWEKDNDW